MTIRTLTFLAIISTSIFSGCSVSSARTDKVTASEFSIASEADPEVRAALEFIAKSPASTLGYQQLAVTYIKRARITGDFSLNEKARTAVRKALEIAPADVSVRKLDASLDLTFHNFDEALKKGTQLAAENPTDAFVYGVLTDANVELGNYPQAVAAAQKMVDLRPNSSSYARVAHLRSLNGQHDGAVEMYILATKTADPQDKEAQAWCLVQLGDEYWKYAKYDKADKLYDEALSLLPEYNLAQVAKGKVRAAQSDLTGAISILEKTSNRIPSAEAYQLLSDIYFVNGDREKSGQYSALVETIESKTGVNNDQRRLVMKWLNNDERLGDALEVATRESAMRQDIYTADTLAWALFKNQKYAEAKAASANAMRLGTNDARILYHAGMIENTLGNFDAAKKLLTRSIAQNPAFDLRQITIARQTLGELRAK